MLLTERCYMYCRMLSFFFSSLWWYECFTSVQSCPKIFLCCWVGVLKIWLFWRPYEDLPCTGFFFLHFFLRAWGYESSHKSPWGVWLFLSRAKLTGTVNGGHMECVSAELNLQGASALRVLRVEKWNLFCPWTRSIFSLTSVGRFLVLLLNSDFSTMERPVADQVWLQLHCVHLSSRHMGAAFMLISVRASQHYEEDCVCCFFLLAYWRWSLISDRSGVWIGIRKLGTRALLKRELRTHTSLDGDLGERLILLPSVSHLVCRIRAWKVTRREK